MAEIIDALKSGDASLFHAGNPITSDEIPALLHQLIQGQEKIVSLLNKLADEK
jgi:alanine-alpha-ketoisovalerate/valine-pyruvate aminotransferase